MFIVEQTGQIKVLDASDELLATPFLNLASQIDDGGNEQGLLGLAFDPDYSNNGYFYVNYTYDPGPGLDRTRVSRFQVSSGDINIADANSEYIIIEIEQDFGNHNGGDIHFGPDGYLYIGMGDGGSSNDPNNRTQTLSATGSASLLGKMLRLDCMARRLSLLVLKNVVKCKITKSLLIPAMGKLRTHGAGVLTL